MKTNALNIDPQATVEEIAKKVTVANELQLKNPTGTPESYKGMWIRVDSTVSATGALTALNTPSNFADDTWIKFRYIKNTLDDNGGLYWKQGASDSGGNPPAGDPATTDNSLVPGVLVIGSPGSEFLSVPSGTPALDRTAGIRLIRVSDSGAQHQVYTEVALGAKPSR